MDAIAARLSSIQWLTRASGFKAKVAFGCLVVGGLVRTAALHHQSLRLART